MKDQHVFNMLHPISRRAMFGGRAATSALNIAIEYASRAADRSGRHHVKLHAAPFSHSAQPRFSNLITRKCQTVRHKSQGMNCYDGINRPLDPAGQDQG